MIVVNGTERDVQGTVSEVLAALDVDGGRGVAVAVDAEVVPKGEWDAFAVPDGARMEIVVAVQGG